jgi:hypothetical protein
MSSAPPQFADPGLTQCPAKPVYSLYAALARTLPFDSELGLGGKLLYAGELGPDERNLLFAANIAGAASLAATADPAVQRQAIRDGVVDFLVTSLEEALRILKNEIRKRQTVSVGVSADPYQLVDQMLDRGVLPDLLPPESWAAAESDGAQAQRFLTQGANRIKSPEPEPADFVTWSVDRQFSRWLPRLDACAKSAIPTDDLLRHRWLRLAPRYLGRLAQREHGVALSSEELAKFRSAVQGLLAHQAQTGDEPPPTIEIRESLLG